MLPANVEVTVRDFDGIEETAAIRHSDAAGANRRASRSDAAWAPIDRLMNRHHFTTNCFPLDLSSRMRRASGEGASQLADARERA
jgi:hypothetical protein